MTTANTARQGTIFVWPDTHAPDHDKRAVGAALDALNAVSPDELLLIGDFIDCKAPARWSKGTADEYANTLVGELDAGKGLLQQIRDAYPTGPISFLVGNHEARINSYLNTYAPAIAGLVPKLPDLLEFDRFGVSLLAQPYRIAPGVSAIHGKALSSVLNSAGQSAFKERARHGTSIIQGHSHRLGIGWDMQDKARFWMEAGHLMDVQRAGYLDFKGHANWQQGFGMIHVKGDRVYPSVHAIHNGESAFAA